MFRLRGLGYAAGLAFIGTILTIQLYPNSIPLVAVDLGSQELASDPTKSAVIHDGHVSREEAERLMGGWYLPPDVEIEGVAGGVRDRSPALDLTYKCGPWMRNYAEFHRQVRKMEVLPGTARISTPLLSAGGGGRGGGADASEEGVEGEWLGGDGEGQVLSERGWGESRVDGTKRWVTFRCDVSEAPCGGFGDVITGLVSTFLVAIATNRLFVVDWPQLSLFFQPNGVDWRMGEDVPVGKGEEGGALVVEDLNLINNSLHESMEDYFDSRRNVTNLVVRWNLGVVTRVLLSEGVWAAKLTRMGMNLPTAFGCILRLLFRMKQSVLDVVAPHLRHLSSSRSRSICIHARVADDIALYANYDGPSSLNQTLLDPKRIWRQQEHLFKCAQKLTRFWFPRGGDVRWVLTSTSLSLKREAQRRLGDVVFTTDIAPQHTAHTTEVAAAYVSTMAEWALFSSSCSMFVSTDAAWSKSAAAFSLRAQSTWIFWRPSAADGPLEKWEGKCDPEHASRAAELGNLEWWSGM